MKVERKPAGNLRGRTRGRWIVPGADTRQIVEPTLLPARMATTGYLPRGGPGAPKKAGCNILLEGPRDIRVFHSSGREVSNRAAGAEHPDGVDIEFDIGFDKNRTDEPLVIWPRLLPT